jgi:hypothetical protein
MVKISSSKEKLLVLAGTVTAAVTGYLAGAGYIAEAGLIGTVAGAVIAFWSEKVNTV